MPSELTTAIRATPAICPLLLFVALLAGCDSSPEGMAPVTGTVSWNGIPLETGFITFTPSSGELPQSGKIQNGKFSFDARLGQNSVSIKATKQAGYVEGMRQHAYEQFIPKKYNVDTELSAEVSSTKTNNYTFDLVEGSP